MSEPYEVKWNRELCICQLVGKGLTEKVRGKRSVIEQLKKVANYADREARKETAEQIATLTAERTALHEMFQRAATADRRTPMTKEDAALLTIGNDTYIVPKAIAARVAELEGALVKIRDGEYKNAHDCKAASHIARAALLTPAPPAAKPETTETPAMTCGTLVWEEGRTIKFDETMVFGVGYDFEAMLLTTEEADTSIGRFAVWSDQIGGNAKWSLYGGTDGWFKSGFSSKEEAQASVQEMHQRALKPTCGTCGTCGGTKQIVSSGHRAVYFRPCPDCAAAEGGAA